MADQIQTSPQGLRRHNHLSDFDPPIFLNPMFTLKPLDERLAQGGVRILADRQIAACRKVARFEPALAQLLIDEWAGAIGAGKIKRSALGYLHELAARLERNQFRSFYAEDIAQVRAEADEDFSMSSGW